ncbi:MAG: DUF6443 domain-containing protein [Bacteroidota bacterium]
MKTKRSYHLITHFGIDRYLRPIVRYLFSVAVLVCACLAPFDNLRAQTYLSPNTVSSTLAPGEYYHNSSITLTPTFTFTATPGNSLSLFISDPFCVPFQAMPSNVQNYVVTFSPRVSGVTDFNQLYTLGTCGMTEQVQYIDGLGRPIQNVTVRGNPDATKDIVQPIEYDQYGRVSRQFLPYAAATGTPGTYRIEALQTGTGIGQSDFYTSPSAGVSPITSAFSKTIFELSPLNRVLEQGAPGPIWQPAASRSTTAGRTVVTDYTSNNNIDWGTDPVNSRKVALYRASINLTDQSRTLTRDASFTATYTDNALIVSIIKDENWTSGRGGTIEEYKDKTGKVVLKRTYNYNTTTTTMEVLSTYYVYDDLGNLAFVLPPGADPDLASNAIMGKLDAFCYQYRYDERNRLTQKKLPGVGPENMVYNQLDQIVYTQDAKQQALHQWKWIKYDAIGRVILTGVENNNTLTPADVLSNFNQLTGPLWEDRSASGPWGYTIRAYPQAGPENSNVKILTASYYDDYNIPGMPSYPVPSGNSDMTRGLLTATRTAVLNPTGSISPDQMWSVHYYDGEGRDVKTYQQHYLAANINANNYDEISTSYDFTGAVTATTRQHHTATAGGAIMLTIANTYDYDHMGRKIKTWESINGATPVLLSQAGYNDIGQLYTKDLHSVNGSPFLQHINYTYNERGWLSKINDPDIAPAPNKLFSLKLNYTDPGHSGTPQYNGNIAEQLYNKGTTGQQFVTYKYDQINRLTAGNSGEGISENGITYDLMGNIQHLQRFGPNAVDLGYTYSGNQLTTVANSGSPFRTYGYDVNGNATSDGLGNTIEYNLLNLPANIPAKQLTYTYDATGQKLRKVSTTGAVTTITDYVGGIQYNNNSNAIDFVITEEGRVLHPSASPNFEYTLSDQLGNNRVTFDQVNGAVGDNDYYPFGLNVPRNSYDGSKYLYNGKEKQEELNNQYDYGARFYDPVIARWIVVDPHVEQEQESTTPYGYVFDDPIKNIDPDGRNPILAAILSAFTEYAGIIGNKMIFEGKSFNEANRDLKWSDAGDIAFAAGLGAAEGVIDGGVSKFASWIAKPRNQKIVMALLKVGVAAVENSIKSVWHTDEKFDLNAIMVGALAEVGMSSLLKTDVLSDEVKIAKNNAVVAERKAQRLAGRPNPNSRKLQKALKKAEEAKKTAQALSDLKNVVETATKTAEKTVSNAASDAAKK